MVYVPGQRGRARGPFYNNYKGGHGGQGGHGGHGQQNRPKKQGKPNRRKGALPQIKYPPDQVFVMTIQEILVEMQMKYSGLFNLSKKTGHKLLDEMARTIGKRMKQVSDGSPDVLKKGFTLSQAYRRMHPHFGDFQLILDTLHHLQDSAGAVRTNLQEGDLITGREAAIFDELSLNKVEAAYKKYSKRITDKIYNHVKELNDTIEADDSKEEIARKKVRTELKKLTPYVTAIIREVISNHFVPRKLPFHKVRMYGEPFMPKKEVLLPMLRQYRAVSITRSSRMYNMFQLAVPLKQFTALMTMDSTVVGGAKLIIRSSDIPMHTIPKHIVRELLQLFGAEHTDIDIDLAEEEMIDDPEEGQDN